MLSSRPKPPPAFNQALYDLMDLRLRNVYVMMFQFDKVLLELKRGRWTIHKQEDNYQKTGNA